MSRIAPYGSWPSPFSAADVAAGVLRLSHVALDGPDVYWLEGRPHEAGRYALVRRRGSDVASEVTPRDLNVRSRVHEYGGGAYAVRNGVVYCVNFVDQRIYRVGAAGTPAAANGAAARPLTPAGSQRYADLEIDTRRGRLICVREDHSAGGQEPINTLVGVPDDDATAGSDRVTGERVLASGEDFYSTPRLSPDGATLAWLSWRHPAMPWDGTELWAARVAESGELASPARLAGGEEESIYQPGWSPDGALYFVSDRDGWWRIYRARGSISGDSPDWTIEPVVTNAPADAEFGRPQWVFGTSTWTFAGPSRLLVSYTRRGRWHLGLVDAASGVLADLAPEVQPHEWIAADATHAVVVGGFDAKCDAIVRLDLETGATESLREASPLPIDAASVSRAEAIEFPTDGGRTAHAFYYAPHHPSCGGPPADRPPLIVMAHGGPTAAARCTFDPVVHYWTTRGFAVADVNYGGSSGYGRAYRQRLRGAWGVVDVQDVVRAAGFLAGGTYEARGADPARLIIRGGSAGGYTALAALTFQPGVFAAGSSYYGICDLELLARDTHKFESRYLESLIGPYPGARAMYVARSPLHAADRLASALILFQGLEDRVVPPNQSQMMAEAARSKGLPVAYLAFEGEQHGFRGKDTMVRSLEAELHFYGVVLGFEPADPVPSIPIDNLAHPNA